MATEVRHRPEQSRYEIMLDGRVVGVADYADLGDALVFHHTEIEASLRQRGLGAELVRGALDDVRARGRTIVPTCWYVAEFVEQHAEYTELLAKERPTNT